MPSLGVGLHLALYGAPAQFTGAATSRIAPDGTMLGEKPVTTGTAIMLSPRVRTQARREIELSSTPGAVLACRSGDLDGHWHCHQHPAVLAMALTLGKPLGLKAVRTPYEGFLLSRRVADGGRWGARLVEAIGHYPLAAGMRRQIRAAGLRTNDHFFGKTDAGAITGDMLARLITLLPEGVTETGLHPATRPWHAADAPPSHWRQSDELRALTDPALKSLARAQNVELCRWDSLA